MAITLYLDVALGATGIQQPSILPLNARLSGPQGVRNLKQTIALPAFGTLNIEAKQQLTPLATLVRRADFIIGHNIHHQLQRILLTASRVGDQKLISLLTPPRFGFDGGETAAICLRQLATEYFDLTGWPPSLNSDSLVAIYRTLYPQQPVLADRITVCEAVYGFLRAFQEREGVVLTGDVVELG